jgi:hypothetical protein
MADDHDAARTDNRVQPVYFHIPTGRETFRNLNALIHDDSAETRTAAHFSPGH